MDEFPLLKTERLSLRQFRPTDATAVFESFSQEAVIRYYNRPPMQSLQEAEELVKIRSSIFGQGFGIRWAIAFMENLDYVIGSCGYYKMDKDNRSVEIGYNQYSAYWCQGFMTETLKSVINFAYSGDFFFYLNRFQAFTYIDYLASVGFLKAGFFEERLSRVAG